MPRGSAGEGFGHLREFTRTQLTQIVWSPGFVANCLRLSAPASLCAFILLRSLLWLRAVAAPAVLHSLSFALAATSP